MKKHLVTATAIVVAGLAVASCASQQRADGHFRQTTENNTAVAREFFRVFSTGNVENILALMRDDATYWVSGSVPGFSGVKTKTQLAKVLAGVGDVYVGGALVLTPSMTIAQGNLVFAEATGRVELKNGRVYEPRSAWVFRVENGLIVEIKEFIDTKHSYEVFLAP